MTEFLVMVNECELHVPGSLECQKRHLEQLFIAIDSGQAVKEEFNAKRVLSRQEFLQVLVHIAVLRYVRPHKAGGTPVTTDVAEAVGKLLCEHIPPRAPAESLQVSNEFREAYLYLPEVDATLAFYEATLRNLFDVYAAGENEMNISGGNNVLASATLMSFDEYLVLCQHFEIVDHDFTLREVRASCDCGEEERRLWRAFGCGLDRRSERPFVWCCPPRRCVFRSCGRSCASPTSRTVASGGG